MAINLIATANWEWTGNDDPGSMFSRSGVQID